MGQVITFYSYKGGVGRTMALANIGVLLAQWGYQVLMVDWDLEAPGLDYFFKGLLDLEQTTQERGVADLLIAQARGEVANWREMLIPIPVIRVKEGGLHLLTAGQRDDQYFRKVRDFDVNSFYLEKGGGEYVEALRDEWKEAYDYVLVDSRTGITDIGGICTIQLPDMLVLLLTATEQGLRGTLDVAQRAVEAQQHLPFDRYRLVSIPVPTRFELTEFELSQQWLRRFASELRPLYREWLPQGAELLPILEQTKIPYIPYFGFGEKLPVVEQGTTDPSGLGYAYETLAALLASDLGHVDYLPERRDEMVRLASKRTQVEVVPMQQQQVRNSIDRIIEQRVVEKRQQDRAARNQSHLFISYSSDDGKDYALKVRDTLVDAGFPVWIAEVDSVTGRPWDEQVEEAIENSYAVLYVMTPGSVDRASKTYDEWSYALNEEKPLIPLRFSPHIRTPIRLARLQYIDFTDDFAKGLDDLIKAVQRLDKQKK